eukprot:6780429-Prymnesium_polylepis.1
MAPKTPPQLPASPFGSFSEPTTANVLVRATPTRIQHGPRTNGLARARSPPSPISRHRAVTRGARASSAGRRCWQTRRSHASPAPRC